MNTTVAYQTQIQKTDNVSKTAFKGSRAITEAERKKRKFCQTKTMSVIN